MSSKIKFHVGSFSYFISGRNSGHLVAVNSVFLSEYKKMQYSIKCPVVNHASFESSPNLEQKLLVLEFETFDNQKFWYVTNHSTSNFQNYFNLIRCQFNFVV